MHVKQRPNSNTQLTQHNNTTLYYITSCMYRLCCTSIVFFHSFNSADNKLAAPTKAWPFGPTFGQLNQTLALWANVGFSLFPPLSVFSLLQHSEAITYIPPNNVVPLHSHVPRTRLYARSALSQWFRVLLPSPFRSYAQCLSLLSPTLSLSSVRPPPPPVVRSS
jgi:hypothetical protein